MVVWMVAHLVAYLDGMMVDTRVAVKGLKRVAGMAGDLVHEMVVSMDSEMEEKWVDM